jgi:hypothetical protein
MYEQVIFEKETAYNIINLTGPWIFLHLCGGGVLNIHPGLHLGVYWALLLVFSLALNLLS